MEKEKLKIELIDYNYQCADGCCTNYGTITKVSRNRRNIRLGLGKLKI